MKKALILGVTGQDGSYAAELLLSKKYIVYGMHRKSATNNKKNLEEILQKKNKNFRLVKGDLLDTISLNNLINEIKPNEIYNYADQDHVGWSYNIPSYSLKTTALSVIEILEIIRRQKYKIKYFQPISSNIFGLTRTSKQSEETIINPNSIYALGKASAYYACIMYNRIYNMNNCGAIFYNHESPRRSEEYLSKKVTKQAVEIYKKKRKKILLGDLGAKIDWGYAKDYVEASWQIMQQKKPDFFVIGTGKNYYVRDFVRYTFEALNLDFKKYVKIDKKLLRPSKTSNLRANTNKAKKVFNSKVKTSLKQLINIMIEHELKKY